MAERLEYVTLPGFALLNWNQIPWCTRHLQNSVRLQGVLWLASLRVFRRTKIHVKTVFTAIWFEFSDKMRVNLARGGLANDEEFPSTSLKNSVPLTSLLILKKQQADKGSYLSLVSCTSVMRKSKSFLSFLGGSSTLLGITEAPSVYLTQKLYGKKSSWNGTFAFATESSAL